MFPPKKAILEQRIEMASYHATVSQTGARHAFAVQFCGSFLLDGNSPVRSLFTGCLYADSTVKTWKNINILKLTFPAVRIFVGKTSLPAAKVMRVFGFH